MNLKDMFVGKMKVAEAIESKGVKKKYIAQQLGITEAHFSRMMNGHHPFQENYKIKIADILNIERDSFV